MTSQISPLRAENVPILQRAGPNPGDSPFHLGHYAFWTAEVTCTAAVRDEEAEEENQSNANQAD